MLLEINAMERIFGTFKASGELLVVGVVLFLAVCVATIWLSRDTFPPRKRTSIHRNVSLHEGVHVDAPSQIPGSRSKRILVIANDVTLAHFARPYQIAKYLIADGHEVVLAASPKSFHFMTSFAGKTHALRQTDSATFLDNLKHGRPLFNLEALKRDAEEDEALIKLFQPDLIIGDFRITLSVTARFHEIPYAAISNAYWDSQYQPQFTVPELPIIGYFGVTLSQFFFNILRPIAFALHSVPMNALRKFYGVSKRSYDVRDVYSDADLLLFSDACELYNNEFRSPNDVGWKQKVNLEESTLSKTRKIFVGPILWSPEVPLPSWWSKLKKDVTTIYVTLGSSGDPQLLPSLVQILMRTKFQVLVSCLGALNISCGKNVFCADFIPADAACAISDLVICNGGNPSTSAAIAKGVPILGIPSNLDQFLNMSYFERAGAAICVRIGELNESKVLETVHKLIDCPNFKQAASVLSRVFSGYNTAERVCIDALNTLFPNASVMP